MTVLPTNTLLGKLDLIEVYEYHDKPLLFACRNASGTHYVVVQIDADDEQEVWFYVSVSPMRFQQVRSGEIDLHDAFAKAEDGFVLGVKVFGDARMQAQVEMIPVDKLSDEQLPDAGERLNLVPAVLG